MAFEVIEHNGRRFAEIIWADTIINSTRFFSPVESSMQFGLLAHDVGFVEAPHTHKRINRTVSNLQQMLIVQRGVVAIDFFTDGGERFREIILRVGDAVLLCDGAHSVRVLEAMQCVSVKQGPFMGAENDKIPLGE